ncbi:MAG: ABC transporter ATP-binding protein [Saprospiraceae bacterium]|nr:ABC transporter ATP-binding protein [Saprospiraceae bacterium]
MIAISGMSFRYKSRQPVLDNLTFSMEAGGVYGILGANGVGKTTLLHLIGGLLSPKSGEITVDGHRPGARWPAFLEQVFYVPVDFDLPRLRVDVYQKRYAPFYPTFDPEVWKNSLQTFGIQPDMQIHALSFGQRKKVLLSFALASGCRVLLLDEPTDGLDIPSKDSFRRLLSAQIDEQRLAVITTHHVHDVAMLLDHLILLKEHALLLQASIPELAAHIRTVTSSQLPSKPALLYSERVPGGYHCLLRNTEEQEGPLDLELLFKAMQLHPEIVQNALRYEKQL